MRFNCNINDPDVTDQKTNEVIYLLAQTKFTSTDEFYIEIILTIRQSRAKCVQPKKNNKKNKNKLLLLPNGFIIKNVAKGLLK